MRQCHTTIVYNTIILALFCATVRTHSNTKLYNVVRHQLYAIYRLLFAFFAKNIDPLHSNSMYCRWEDVHRNSINFVVSHQPPRSAASTVIATLQALYNGCIAIFYRLRFTERV